MSKIPGIIDTPSDELLGSLPANYHGIVECHGTAFYYFGEPHLEVPFHTLIVVSPVDENELDRLVKGHRRLFGASDNRYDNLFQTCVGDVSPENVKCGDATQQLPMFRGAYVWIAGVNRHALSCL